MQEIVIKIPEEMYEWINDANKFYEDYGISDFVGLIKNGTVLPKGHGRLIDADELKKHKYHDNDRFENAVAVAQIDWADTVIESDRSEE